MGYPTQFSMSGKVNKRDIEYHISILYEEINFDWSKIEFKYQDGPIFFHLQYRFLCMENLKPEHTWLVQIQNDTMSKHCLCVK